MTFKIEWMDAGREAKNPSNPAYQDGVVVDLTLHNDPGCVVALPYPAPRCGSWRIECETCGYTVAVTAAGRRDDPREVRLTCRRSLQ